MRLNTGYLGWSLAQLPFIREYVAIERMTGFTFFRNYFRQNVEEFIIDRTSKNAYHCIFIHGAVLYRRVCKNAQQVCAFWSDCFNEFAGQNFNGRAKGEKNKPPQ